MYRILRIRQSNTSIIIILLLLCSCSYSSSRVTVNLIGDREQIFNGDIKAQLNIKDLKKEAKRLYGIGPVSKLQGEITVIEKPYISRVIDGELIIDNNWDREAIFFVYSYVDKWKTLNHSQVLYKNREELEKYLTELIKKENYKSKNIPVLIEAEAKTLVYHIMNKTNSLAHNKKEHQKAKHIIELKNTPIKLLAFYSEDSDPSFSHGKFHFHFISDDKKYSGHLDSFSDLDIRQILLPE